MNKLDLIFLEKSINTLEKSINSYDRLCKDLDLNADDISALKSGVIHNFKVAYEQSWKFMKRWLENNINSESVDGITRKELFRLARENKLITNIEAWFRFHESRNLTSHTYDQNTADLTFETAHDFLKEAKELIINIKNRND